jgi:hypothetical protein
VLQVQVYLVFELRQQFLKLFCFLALLSPLSLQFLCWLLNDELALGFGLRETCLLTLKLLELGFQ